MLTDTGKERGTLTFVDIMSGRKLWQAKLPKSVHTFCASPVVTGDQLYLVRRDGTVFTARLGKEGISGLKTISLDEGGIATPVVVDGKVIIRGDTHLVCLW